MNTYPEIITERLILGKILTSDIPKIVEYAGNEKIAETTLNMPHPYYEKDAIFWINSAYQGIAEKTQYTFAIRDKNSSDFLGGIGLKVNQRYDQAEFGYWIAEQHWNLGYATEATKGIIDFGFNRLKLHKIFANYLVGNPSSGKVMIKNGMIKEGELKDHTKKDGIYKSLYQYRLTRDEFDNL